ncbi:MAG: hypothetical protein JXA01_10865 [Dehalococcoidia bacterium]|nr:hypothetical protein [Dehalococcoidia bacterium]
MEDTSKMLSQDEIDAMVSKTSIKPVPAHKMAPAAVGAPVKSSPPAQPVQNIHKVSIANMPSQETPESATQVGHVHEVCIAAGEINTLNERLSEIANRLSRLELIVNKLENNTGSPGAQANPAALKTAMQQIHNVSSQVEVISEGLRGTAGYNINKVFSCGSCGSVGVVAVKVKCTKCGQENWWGWWPKKINNE